MGRRKGQPREGAMSGADSSGEGPGHEWVGSAACREGAWPGRAPSAAATRGTDPRRTGVEGCGVGWGGEEEGEGEGEGEGGVVPRADERGVAADSDSESDLHLLRSPWTQRGLRTPTCRPSPLHLPPSDVSHNYSLVIPMKWKKKQKRRKKIYKRGQGTCCYLPPDALPDLTPGLYSVVIP